MRATRLTSFDVLFLYWQTPRRTTQNNENGQQNRRDVTNDANNTHYGRSLVVPLITNSPGINPPLNSSLYPIFVDDPRAFVLMEVNRRERCVSSIDVTSMRQTLNMTIQIAAVDYNMALAYQRLALSLSHSFKCHTHSSIKAFNLYKQCISVCCRHSSWSQLLPDSIPPVIVLTLSYFHQLQTIVWASSIWTNWAIASQQNIAKKLRAATHQLSVAKRQQVMNWKPVLLTDYVF